MKQYTDSELQDELTSRGWHGIYWNADDVLHQAQERGIRIDEDEADALMEGLVDNHDATIGITWDTINMYLRVHSVLQEEHKEN